MSMERRRFLSQAAATGALLALAGAIFTSRSSPYAAVVDRVVKLEAQRELDVLKIEKLQHKVGELEDGRANDQTEISGLQRRIAGVFEDRDDLVSIGAAAIGALAIDRISKRAPSVASSLKRATS